MSFKEVTEFEAGERLDRAVTKLFPEYSRSAIEKLIISGNILVNQRSKKSKYTLKTSDILTVDFSELEKEPEEIELPILYEDENVIVINKPVGILAHAKGAFSKEGTVASWLKTRILPVAGSILVNNRAGIVHRLDRGTSGVMIVAKNKQTQDYLQAQFSKRNVKKIYIAVIGGKLPEKEGLIDIPIGRNPKKPATFRADSNGKSAQTEFKLVCSSTHGESEKEYSLIELKPITGRTHQLRVHVSYLKHPIVGDGFYGGQSASRLMLHAKSLEITLPGGIRKVFKTDIPKEIMDLVQ